MTFTEHLEELRTRLTRCLVAVFIGFLACYGFAEQLFLLLMDPLIQQLAPSGGSLIYTGLPEAFFTHVKVGAIAGLFLVSPYVFYQLWMFIAPGLYEGERKMDRAHSPVFGAVFRDRSHVRLLRCLSFWISVFSGLRDGVHQAHAFGEGVF